MPKSAYADHMQVWSHLADQMESEALDLHHLQPYLTSLQEGLREARAAKTRQLELRAAAQQATRDLEAAMAKANDAATRLHTGLLGAYGTKSTTLIAFGMRPHRSAKLAPSDAETAAAVSAALADAAEVRPGGGSVPQSGPEAAVLAPAPLRGGGRAPRPGRLSTAGRGGVPPPERVIGPDGGTVPQPGAAAVPEAGTAPPAAAEKGRRRATRRAKTLP